MDKKNNYYPVTCKRGVEQGSKSPFSLLSEPISPSYLLFGANFSLLPKRLRFFFSLLPTFSPYFSLLPTFFGPFLPPPCSVPPPPVMGQQTSQAKKVYSKTAVLFFEKCFSSEFFFHTKYISQPVERTIMSMLLPAISMNFPS